MTETSTLRDRFTAATGIWGPAWQGMLDLDPAFLEAYLAFASVPAKKGHLDAKTRAFIGLTVDAAATHLHEPGIRHHIETAIANGATPQEVMEVIELTSTLGIHAMNVHVPVLAEVLEARGQGVARTGLDEAQEALKAEFVAKRGFWNDAWEQILVFDPEIFAAYTTFSSVPWVGGTLGLKTKSLIYMAFDSSATHLYSAGVRAHMNNALDAGATTDEILETLEIVSVIGIHAATVAVPILIDVLNANQKDNS